MRVGFDATVLARPHPPGVARAASGLLDALEARGRVEVVRLEPGADETPRSFRRGFADAVRARGLAGVHSFTSAFAWRGAGKRVQTVHELPWRHGVREHGGARHRLWAALGPLAADRVVVPTEHVARDLRRRILPGAAKVRVVPWGVGPPFADEPPAGTVDEVVLERHRLDATPFALCVGAVREKKDLAAVVRGLAALRARGGADLALVVTGDETPDLRRDLGLASSLGLSRWVRTLGRIEDDELAALLRLACCAPVLSRSEGFGLPVLEALACGTPVLVPPASAQAEVAGDAGFEVDPADAETVADGLARALTEREALRYALPARAASFTWDAAAARIEAVWEELA